MIIYGELGFEMAVAEMSFPRRDFPHGKLC